MGTDDYKDGQRDEVLKNLEKRITKLESQRLFLGRLLIATVAGIAAQIFNMFQMGSQ